MNDNDLIGLVDDDILYGGDHDIVASHQSGSSNVVKTTGMVLLGALFGAGLIKFVQKMRGSASKHDQGYDAREDESIGMRLGAQSHFSQSQKDRRDESYGAFGHRPDQHINR